MSERFFAPCPRGLEQPLAAELATLARSDIVARGRRRGVRRRARPRYRANLESRIASRILWRVGSAAYRDERDLYALVHAHRLDAALHAGAHAARRRRGDALAADEPRVRDAAHQGRRLRSLSRGPRRASFGRQARARCARARASHRPRGRRSTSTRRASRSSSAATVATPTRRRCAKTSPRGCWRLANGHPSGRFLDPMCGSGTIVTEAALIAADRAPGLSRTFGFQKLAWYDGPTWQRIRQAARDRMRRAPASVSIFASDIAGAAVARTHRRCAAAQVDAFVHVEQADVLTRAAPAAAGLLLANPPYGVRLADARELEAFYPQLGDALKQRFSGWTAVLLHRRPASREADRPQGRPADSALERRDRMPALRVPRSSKGRCADR